MSIIHVNQIKNRITTLFSNKIDLSDVKASGKDREDHFLTRGLAAYAVYHLAKTDIDSAAAAVVDSGGDNGIDALHADESEKRLYIVQAKWIHDGKGEPSNGDVKKFTSGVRDLFTPSLNRFSAKVQSKQAIILKALNEPGWTYFLVLAYTGVNNLATPSSQDLGDLADEMNDASELVFINVLNQQPLHTSLASPLSGQPIVEDITLLGWGKVDAPHRAFYGQVTGTEVKHWWDKHGSRLFAQNLRNMLGDTEVNDAPRP